MHTRARDALLLAASIGVALLLSPAVAQAQTDPVPNLPTSGVTDTIQSVLPSASPTADAGDVVDGADDDLIVVTVLPPKEEDDEQVAPDEGGGSNESTQAPASTTTRNAGTAGATTGTSRTHPQPVASPAPTLVAKSARTYPAEAARSAVVAAARAARLAGPLAPPLVIAGIAIAALIGMGRGSEGLLKAEASEVLSARRYRL